jgi:excisionase family DNA binding protein
MPTEIHGETYYRTSEAARLAGISRSTLIRWLDKGIIKDASRRDRRGWRLFTKADVKRITDEAHKVK